MNPDRVNAELRRRQEGNQQRNERAREEMARAVAEATQVQVNDGKTKCFKSSQLVLKSTFRAN